MVWLQGGFGPTRRVCRLSQTDGLEDTIARRKEEIEQLKNAAWLQLLRLLWL